MDRHWLGLRLAFDFDTFWFQDARAYLEEIADHKKADVLMTKHLDSDCLNMGDLHAGTIFTVSCGQKSVDSPTPKASSWRHDEMRAALHPLFCSDCEMVHEAPWTGLLIRL